MIGRKARVLHTKGGTVEEFLRIGFMTINSSPFSERELWGLGILMKTTERSYLPAMVISRVLMLHALCNIEHHVIPSRFLFLHPFVFPPWLHVFFFTVTAVEIYYW